MPAPSPTPTTASRRGVLASVLPATAIGLAGCSLRLKPLPDTVDEELENALDRGFDGIIV